MNLVKLKCTNCGAKLEVNSNLDKIICNYCGEEILIDDEATSQKRLDDAKLKSRKENHEQDLKERQDNLEQHIREKEILDKLNAKDKFKKSKFSKALLVFFAFAVFTFFSVSGFWAKFLVLIQAILFIGSWLFGMEIIKEPRKGIGAIMAIIAFVLIVPILNGDLESSSYTREYDKINWDYIILKEYLPKPKSSKGNIYINSDDNLNIDLSIDSEDEYREYIEKCKEKGYTINMKNGTSSYEAYNKEGYKLRLSYSDYSNEYSIILRTNTDE